MTYSNRSSYTSSTSEISSLVPLTFILSLLGPLSTVLGQEVTTDDSTYANTPASLSEKSQTMNDDSNIDNFFHAHTILALVLICIAAACCCILCDRCSRGCCASGGSSHYYTGGSSDRYSGNDHYDHLLSDMSSINSTYSSTSDRTDSNSSDHDPSYNTSFYSPT